MIQFGEKPRAVFIFISDLQSVDLIERVPVCIGGDGWRNRNGAMEKAPKQLSQKKKLRKKDGVRLPYPLQVDDEEEGVTIKWPCGIWLAKK